MQHLQWFPGHMTAAMRMMEENLKFVDGVVLVLDARAPFSSRNLKLEKLFAGKKVLFAINKSDLIEKSDLNAVLKKFADNGEQAIGVCANDKKTIDKLSDRIFALLSDVLERNRQKGVKKPLRVMVAGIPNTGKSTIINALCGGKKAQTGDKAGVTKGKQWVRIRDIELLDTPGTMPPAFENQTFAKRLAYIGSMNDANLDFADLTFEFLSDMKEKYPDLLKAKYGVTDATAPTLRIMEEICARRGFLLRGGEYDFDRCATAVIDDFRKGRIGKILLD